MINLGTLDVLMGLPTYDKTSNVRTFNFVILYAKQFIYTCKNVNKAIELYDFQVTLKSRMEVEKLIYTNQNRKDDFERLWSRLYDSL